MNTNAKNGEGPFYKVVIAWTNEHGATTLTHQAQTYYNFYLS